ncbi:MAG: c-type cytochrome [Opitutaceae bacterium]|nr:c-type cytochrome [Opitutaceae bacterium]
MKLATRFAIASRTMRMACALGAGGSGAALLAADRHPALAPEQALAAFRVEAGLRVELVAAEPLTVDPVAFAFDGPGRMFVVENRGYPDAQEGSVESTAGRIALLEDTDGDGRMDRRTEFATGLGLVNGLALWRGGMFVTAAPDILYLKDTDGDGVADERRVVLTGFDISKTAQIRVSHPTLGLDGKIYVTGGLNGGKVTSPLHPERAPVVFTAQDGRFDPETLIYEKTGGRGQFGLAFDAFGRRFVTDNRRPILHVVLEPWHLRNPNFAFSETMQEVSKVQAEAKVLPISRASITADFIPKLMGAPHTGTFTSACGLVIFGGTGLMAAHVGDVFVCEPAQNLVQRQTLRVEGASFRSDARIEGGREFLASTDVWFRPVFAGEGPDGALYVADMYRREIDHPRYVPEGSRGLLDFESGKDRGRIWRIVRDEPRLQLNLPASDDLVAGLEAEGEWWRARAQRLIVDRQTQELAPALTVLAERGKTAAVRTRALWTLRGLGKLSPANLVTALRDGDARVREQGVLLAAEHRDSASGLKDAVLAATADSDARVRFVAALAVDSHAGPAATSALADVALRDGADRWARAAVLSGIGGRLREFLAALRQHDESSPANFAIMMEQLGRVFGVGASAEDCREFVAPALHEGTAIGGRIAAVLGLAEGLRVRSAPKFSLNSLLRDGDSAALAALHEAAAHRAMDERASKADRVAALALLGYGTIATAGQALGRALDARQSPEIQQQAIRAIERIGDPRGAELLMAQENWPRYTPPVREAAVAALAAKPALTAVLFAAIKGGTVSPLEISSTRRAQLLKHSDAAMRKAAEAIFQQVEAGDRMKVYQRLRTGFVPGTDVASGRAAFARACAACHTFRGQGSLVGPDLSGLRHQPADAILLHIIVPNYEVAPSYQMTTVTTQDGRTLAGWLAAETESSLTLRTAAGTEETVLRANVAALTASGLSVMPDGLEQTMTGDELANLIGFLKSDH